MKIINWVYYLLRPISQGEDNRRREWIFNIFVLLIISISLLALLINIVLSLRYIDDTAVPPYYIFVLLLFFISLYLISRRGHTFIASNILIWSFFCINSLSMFSYGVDLPEGLLVYALIIGMAGALISTRFALIMTGIIVIFIVVAGLMRIYGLVATEEYWRTQDMGVSNVIFIVVMLLSIALLAWMSNREIERSLKRARKSEEDLKKERDMLEIVVENRTRELREIQAEQMISLYRFAEFGRLSAGLFHDLINPLTALSMNMENLRGSGFVSEGSNQMNTHMNQALQTTEKIKDFISSIRRQISKQDSVVIFPVVGEIQHVVDVLKYKARMKNVNIIFENNINDMKLSGDPVKFGQIILNLVSNAIDAYSLEMSAVTDDLLHVDESIRRAVVIILDKIGDMLIISVRDNGMGISENIMQKIFDPFFTTKNVGEGLGIGLSSVKRIVEKDFCGSIVVKSKVGIGSEFLIKIPLERLPICNY